MEFIPCDSKGNEDVDVYVDDPLDMVSLHRIISTQQKCIKHVIDNKRNNSYVSKDHFINVVSEIVSKVNKNIAFKVKIPAAMNLPDNYIKVSEVEPNGCLHNVTRNKQ